MFLTLFFLCFTILSLPAYRILNAGQICLFIISSAVILVYYFRRALFGKELTIKFPIYLMAIIVASVSYNLKAEKGWIGYIPLAQLLIALIFFIYVLVLSKRKKINAIRDTSYKDRRLAFVFAGIAIVFMALALGAWINFLCADTLYRQGNNQLKYGKIDEAILNFTKAIDKKPSLYSIYPKLLNILYRKGQYDKIINICKKNTSYLRMTFGYYDVFCFYLGSSYFREEKLDEALSYYDKLISVDRDGSIERDFGTLEEFSFYRGHRYARFKKLDEALGEFKKALSVGPKNYLIQFKIAETHYFLGKAEDALKIFEELVSFGFIYKDMFFYAADLYNQKGMLDKAIVMYEQYATIDLDKDKFKEAYSKGYAKIAQIYESLSEWDKAIAAYKKLFLFSFSETEGHRHLGSLYEKLGRYYDAMHEFRKIMANKNSEAEGSFLLGDMYLKLGINSLAKNYYMQTIALGSHRDKESYTYAVKRIGHIYLSKGLLNEAVRWFKKLNYVSPGEMYHEIALAYIDKGLFDKALEICNEAHKNKTIRAQFPYNLVPPYRMLLDKYKEMGRLDKVTVVSEKLLTFEPQYVANRKEIAIELIKQYESNGKRDDALRICRIFLNVEPKSKEIEKMLNRLLNEKRE